MQLFYTQQIIENIAILEGDEWQHCIKTLRKRVGEQVLLIDGVGHYYETELIEITKKNASLKILRKEERPLPWDFHIHLAIAPTKNMDRLEWFVEKAIEIGINEITPIQCRYSERKNLRLDRLEKIALSAAKQSHKFVLPRLNELTDFSSFLETNNSIQRFIAHCYEDKLPHLKTQFQYSTGTSVLVMIGPEGDFSEIEVKEALSVGYQAIGLGKSRLRTETAGIVACHSLQLSADF
jgi:16S rRNA (uracil1498-N3)-methyltransferase